MYVGEHCGASKIQVDDKHELLDGMLFIRVRDGYASTLKLITNDFHLEAGIIARSTVEAFLVFNGHINHRAKAYDYLTSQYKYDKKKIINRTLKNKKYQTHIGKAKSFDMSQLDGARNIKAFEWAKLAGQEDLYDYSYTFLSKYVHVNLESLEKRLATSGDKIIGFRQLQDDYDLELILFTIIDVLLQSIELLKKNYNSLSLIKIEQLSRKFSSIANGDN